MKTSAERYALHRDYKAKKLAVAAAQWTRNNLDDGPSPAAQVDIDAADADVASAQSDCDAAKTALDNWDTAHP